LVSFAPFSTYYPAADALSLVDLAEASGAASREVNASPDFAVGASYYLTSMRRVTGVRFWWLRATGVPNEPVKLSLWDEGLSIRLASVTVTVASDGPQEAYFAAPVDVPADTRLVVTTWHDGAHCKLLTTGLPILAPVSFGGTAASTGNSVLVGPGIYLEYGAVFNTGDTAPTQYNAYTSTHTLWPVEPILDGARRPPGSARHVYVEGDSIPAGYGISVGTPGVAMSWAKALHLPPGSTLTIAAVASSTLDDNANNDSGSTNSVMHRLPTFAAGYDAANPRDFICDAGRNSLYFMNITAGGEAAAAAAVLAEAVAVASYIRTHCPRDRVWFRTQDARGNWASSSVYGGTDAPYNTALAIVNAGLAAALAPYSGRVIDTSGDARLADSSNTTNFQGDECHLAWPGHLVVALYVRRALGTV
jgi:hypothetical protein